MNVGQICSRQVLSIPTGAPLVEVARLMCSSHVGAVVVTKAPSDRLVAAGMITDRDILRAQVDRPASMERLRAEDVMSFPPLELNENMPLEEAIRRMRERGVRRAPVISDTGALVGVVSTDDLMGEVAREIGALARIVEKQARHEAG